ncbi:dNA polymerase III subunit gamma and tau [Clostridium sp. CAG:524]|jgi:DNA polymerase-3 subunit gamma/tau|nr:dNA polymerase III subunit gamma and tau [Clostridium sp. CAG:524]
MEYISLYRKYRPKTFSDVVGQEVVVKILKNSILNNKISHAYIFSGPRGTGKTSIAKIFSKAVNCLNTTDGDLCNNCENCLQNIDEEIDIIEIDAASNNGVDEIREIRNNVKLMPVHLKYKVYIIDEVHMLSTSAFNALLKTLEEPPKHVIFILATTEFNKIPATVISRCQKFDFKKITNKQIEDRLKYILEQEKKSLNGEVISLIAKLSDGGLRDAINMLDQVISLEKENVTVDDVYNLIGDISEKNIIILLENIVSGNIKETLKNINEYYEEGKNFINICERLQLLIRNIIIFNNTDNYFDKEYEKKLLDFSHIELEYCEKMSDELFNLINELKRTNNQKIITEISFLKMCLMQNKKEEKNIDKIETKNNSKDNEIPIIIEEKQNEEKEKNKSIKINNVFCGPSKELKNNFVKNYEKLKEFLSIKEYNSLVNLLLKATPQIVTETNVLFTFKNNFDIVLFDNKIEEIQDLLRKIFGKKYSVVAVNNEEYSNILKEYKKNIDSGKIYKYIEEPHIETKDNKNTKIENTAETLFGKDCIIVE